MTNLRDRPLRLEAALTRDYINRPQKMKEIERGLTKKNWYPAAVAVLCVLCGIIVWVALMQYYGGQP